MAEINKSWPANVDAHTVAEMFSPDNLWLSYYFTLGRGKPKQSIDRIWYTWRGRILGSFKVDRIVQNDGSLPTLSRIDNIESDWNIKPDMWVAICDTACDPLNERVFMSGFRGYRY